MWKCRFCVFFQVFEIPSNYTKRAFLCKLHTPIWPVCCFFWFLACFWRFGRPRKFQVFAFFGLFLDHIFGRNLARPKTRPKISATSKRPQPAAAEKTARGNPAPARKPAAENRPPKKVANSEAQLPKLGHTVDIYSILCVNTSRPWRFCTFFQISCNP